jgi:uncharacterized membrane protein YbaN (DUF454 family)
MSGSRLRRSGLILAGFVFTGLAAAGVLLPLVPTTPFLLLAGACFARSSPRFHGWLLRNRAFGPYLGQWQRDRTIPRSAKRKAYLLVAATFAISIAVVDIGWVRAALATLGIGLILFLFRLPTSNLPQGPTPPEA